MDDTNNLSATGTGLTLSDDVFDIGYPPYDERDMHDIMCMDVYAAAHDDDRLRAWFKKGAEAYDPGPEGMNHLLLTPLRWYPMEGQDAEQAAIAFTMAVRAERQWPARVFEAVAADIKGASIDNKSAVFLRDIVRESKLHGNEVTQLASNAGLQHLAAG